MNTQRTMASPQNAREQYATTSALVARQRLWNLQPGRALADTVLARADLRGTETVVDVGCGNGLYLAALRRRGHAGPILGLDLSPTMARRARAHARTAVADAQALPLRDHSVDLALCPHMLYHVPDIPRAIGELRRVVRPGGTLLATTNDNGHNREVKRILGEASRRVTGLETDIDWDTQRFPVAVAETLLGAAFDRVEVIDRSVSFPVPDPVLIRDYLASWPVDILGRDAEPAWEDILAEAETLAATHVARHGAFTVTSRAAILHCG